jgi:hypothetical protein
MATMKVRQLYSPREMMRRGQRYDIRDASKLKIEHSRTFTEAGEPARDVYFVTQPASVGPGTEPITGFFSREAAENFIEAVQQST